MSETKKQNLGKEHQELIATAALDTTYPLALNMYRNMDVTLQKKGGGKGLKIYDDIERDTHAYGVLQKRKQAVVARDWHVEPHSDDAQDVKAAELVEAALKRIKFDQLCIDLMDASLKGFAVSEIMWGYVNGHILPVGTLAINQRRFAFDKERQPRLLTQSDMVKGMELPDRKFIVHRFGSKDGNPFGLGLGSRLYWPVYFKRQGIAMWMVFVEKFAAPTAVGKYPESLNKKERQQLLQSVQSIAQQSGIIVPDGTELDLLEATRGGNASSYKELCRYMDEQISEAVLGETLSTNIGDVGSKAASETHNDVREELTDADCDLLTDTLDDMLVRWIIDFNMPGANLPSVKRVKPENELEKLEVQKKKADTWKTLVEVGYEPTEEEVQKHFGEGFVKRQQAQPQPSEFSEHSGHVDFASDDDPVVSLAAQLNTIAGVTVNSWVEEIRALVEGAEHPEEVQQGLLELYAESLPADELGEVVAQALAVSELTGMAEVDDA